MDKLLIKNWEISTQNYKKDNLSFYESIFSQGNGYVGIRGYIPEDKKINGYHRSSFMAGFFELFKPGITDMVNLPDMFSNKISINNTAMDFERDEVSDFNQVLSMKNGLLIREYVHTKDNKSTRIRYERIVSLDNIHQIATRYTITPINHNSEIIVKTGIDADVNNNPIADDQLVESTDVVEFWESKSISSEIIKGSVHLQTNFAKKELAVAYKLVIDQEHCKVTCSKTGKGCTNSISIKSKQGKSEIIEKFISLHSYHEKVTDNILQDSVSSADVAASIGFEGILKKNTAKWEKIWKTSDIEIEGNEKIQGAIRYNIFQLIQTYNNGFPYASVGARGLMHGRYKGCYFWDAEIFILPFFMYTNPQAARNMLLYRYNMLEDSKIMAKNYSLQGARYSWMCSDTGLEQCESWDIGSCEVHITADIAYALDRYINTQNDTDFLVDYGCEIFIETARYWLSRLTYNQFEDKYNMLFVKGPDEYCGVTMNNTYTNFMCRYNLECAINSIESIKQLAPMKWEKLSEKINFTKEEVDNWKDAIEKISINYDKEKDLFIEDDLFLTTDPINVGEHKNADEPLYKKISYDRLQRYRVLKQADIIQLMIMHPQSFSEMQMKNAWDFYEPITAHDSTLSFGSHAEHAAKIAETEKAQIYFMKSLFLDLEDVMGNTAKEGLHTASLGATWKSIVYGFVGLDDTQNEPSCKPNLPECINRVKFKFHFKGNLWEADITKEQSKFKKC